MGINFDPRNSAIGNHKDSIELSSVPNRKDGDVLFPEGNDEDLLGIDKGSKPPQNSSVNDKVKYDISTPLGQLQNMGISAQVLLEYFDEKTGQLKPGYEGLVISGSGTALLQNADGSIKNTNYKQQISFTQKDKDGKESTVNMYILEDGSVVVRDPAKEANNANNADKPTNNPLQGLLDKLVNKK